MNGFGRVRFRNLVSRPDMVLLSRGYLQELMDA